MKLTTAAVLGVLLSVMVACGGGSGVTPPPTQLTQDQAWTGDLPADAQIVSQDEFTAGLDSGDQTLISSADLAAQKAARDTQFQQDKSFLQALSNKSPAVQALLAQAASATTSDGDRPVKLRDGQTVRLYGLGTQLKNAVQAEQLDQSVDNALSDYQLTYDLLPDSVKAQAASPDRLKGQPLAEVKAALEQLNSLLDNQLSPVRLEPNVALSRQDALNPGNGTDNNGPCTAPTNYEAKYWFPLKNFVSPIKNQANRGVCWAFAAIGAVESRERVQNNHVVDLSEQFLVNKVKQDWDAEDYEEGYWSENALNTATDKGQQIPAESGWTYNPSNSRGAGTDDDADSFGNSCNNYSGTCSDTAHQSRRSCTTIIFKFCSYKRVSFSGPGVAPGKTTQVWKNGDHFDLNRYRLLMNQGHVLLTSMPVYKGFRDDVGSDGVVSNYNQTQLDATGKEVSGSYGGHELQIIGFLSNDDLSSPGHAVTAGGGGYFVLKNSWGCRNGDGGYYYVPADYVQQFFETLSVLNFDARRSDAWTREQATPGGSQAPSIQVLKNPAQVDLRAGTDLAQFFKVSHPVAKSVTLTVTSTIDGVLYNGPWSLDPLALVGPSLKVTFVTAGPRTLTLLAKYGSSQASAVLNITVVNTPPTLNLSGSGDAHQGEAYSMTAVITDPNESDVGRLCASTSWSVTAPDTVSPSTGCQVQVSFGATGVRTVRASTQDSGGATGSQAVGVHVLPPLANPYPQITSAGVYGCLGPQVSSGATIDLNGYTCATEFVARVAVNDPSGEALTYDWTLFITVNGKDQVLESVQGQSGTSFSLGVDKFASVDAPCHVNVQVNAPDSSRSKAQTVWTGTCLATGVVR